MLRAPGTTQDRQSITPSEREYTETSSTPAGIGRCTAAM
jgi:hypothetical protein